MVLEPELLKLALPLLLVGQYVSWAVAAGAAGTLPHELVLLVRLRLLGLLLLSSQRVRAECADLLLLSDRAGLPFLSNRAGLLLLQCRALSLTCHQNEAYHQKGYYVPYWTHYTPTLNVR